MHRASARLHDVPLGAVEATVTEVRVEGLEACGRQVKVVHALAAGAAIDDLYDRPLFSV